MVIWLRVGDGDDYHKFKTVESAAQHLKKKGIKAVWRYAQWGIAAIGFEGQNYISAYWGPSKQPDAEKDLTDDELTKINEIIA